jgi:hypothetical protein
MPILAMPNMPPQIQERIVCSISAALKYQVPANIILAVSEKEAGKPGQWVRNSNGTHDVGQMQFNTAYLKELRVYGITPGDVADAGCYAFDLAAWRIGYHIRHDKGGDIWTRSANYHSRTYRYNSVYRADLIKKALKWADWLDARFATYDVTKQKAKPAIIAEQKLASTVSLNTEGYIPNKVTFNRRP